MGIRKLIGMKRFVLEFAQFNNFVKSAKHFKEQGGSIDSYSLHLDEIQDSAGSASGHYFWQDLIVAQWVLKQGYRNIVDLGSRLDGYISNIAASRPLSVIDIRPLSHKIPNVEFIQADILQIRTEKRFDLITSLHTIEHIGLGRYGDQIDPHGHIKAFEALVTLLVADGHLVVSFPISPRTEVEFNGQRKIGFKEPLEWAKSFGLDLIQFIHLDSKDKLSYFFTVEELDNFVPESGNLGIYFFKKVVN